MRLLPALAIAVLCCRPAPAARAEADHQRKEDVAVPARQNTVAPSADSTRGLPNELAGTPPLWESASSPTPTRQASTTRLYPNGQLYGWSSTRRVLVNGKPRREPAPPAWRLEAQVGPETVERVRELVRTGFAALDGGTPASLGRDQGTTTYRASDGGATYTVTVASQATAQLPAPIREIDAAIQRGIIPGAVPMEQQP